MPAAQVMPEAAAHTSLVTRWADDGTATIRIRLPNDEAAVVAAAVDERVKKMDLPANLPWEARRAQARVSVVADGATVTDPKRERHPDLITITPEPAGGCLVTVELTTHPTDLTTTLTAIGIEPLREQDIPDPLDDS